MKRFSALATVLLFWFCGCDSVAEGSTEPNDPPTAAAPVAHVHDLICGCALPAVGHCGEYIKVGGEFVELVGDLELGKMPFCGKQGLQGEIAGELKDGKFFATSFELVN